jgi:predicted alpha-1,2-mannosidase
MKPLALILATSLLSGLAFAEETNRLAQPGRDKQPVDMVNCLIGTHNERWMTFPGPCRPFGMVKLSPDTRLAAPGAFFWKAGYEYTLPSIAGFNNVHEWTMAGLATMPTTGELRTQPGDAKKPGSGYRSRFRHETEVAVPGYYAVTLEDYKIRAELTATTRCGFERYTFPKADDARVLVALWIPDEYGYQLTQANVRKVSANEIEGTASHAGTNRHATFQVFNLHFVMRFSKPMRSLGGWLNGKVLEDIPELSGKDDMGVFANFVTREGEPVLIQTGISLVSIEQARLNLETETKPFGWDFDACRAQARNVWNDLLGKIQVEGGGARDRAKFYVNLYRCFCARTIWSDVNGKYIDPHGNVQQLANAQSPMFGSDAFWNTFWNLNQLWILATPDLAEQWVRCQLEFHDKGGWLTKGAPGLKYSGIMTGEHEIALLVAAYQHGLRGFDAEKAWQAIQHILTVQGERWAGNLDLDLYLKYHYIPADSQPESGFNYFKNYVSNTMEYSYDDWCAAQLAKALGKPQEYAAFMARSRYWTNMFDSASGYTRPKNADGTWVEPLDPFRNKGFVEGNAWQYTWFVPQDVRGLITAMGRDRFIERLDQGMIASQPGNFAGGRYVNHGNEPTMQAAYLFNHAGVPWLTQKYARAIMNQYYGDTPMHGWLGDEDQGQMGAWFVMSAIGLFQVDGGCRTRPIYEIGSPLFDRAVVRLDPRYYPGKSFVIETRNNAPANCYIQSATLNGQPWSKPWLYAEQVQRGGCLALTMGPEPNKNWGAGMENAPPPAD